MGMDLKGFDPKSEKGKAFRNNLCWWPSLWSYYIEIAGDKIDIEWELGFYNDGFGLDKNQANKLAEILEEKLASGAVKEVEERVKAWNHEMSNRECLYCEGTGGRKRHPETGPGDVFCNGCSGTGKQPFDERIYFTEANVRKFFEFVKDSGGFDIY